MLKIRAVHQSVPSHNPFPVRHLCWCSCSLFRCWIPLVRFSLLCTNEGWHYFWQGNQNRIQSLHETRNELITHSSPTQNMAYHSTISGKYTCTRYPSGILRNLTWLKMTMLSKRLSGATYITKTPDNHSPFSTWIDWCSREINIDIFSILDRMMQLQWPGVNKLFR